MHGLLFCRVVFLDGFVGKYFFFVKVRLVSWFCCMFPRFIFTLIWNWGMVVWGEWEGLMFFEGSFLLE